MPKKKKIAIISSTLLTSRVIFLLLNVYIFGIFSSLLGLFIYFCVQSFFLRKNMLYCVLPADLKFWVPEKSSIEPAPQNVLNAVH